MKKGATLMAMFVVSLLAMSLVSAAEAIPVNIEEVQINGNVIGDDEHLYVEEGDDISIQVKLVGTGHAENVELEASIRGYEYGDYESLTDQTHVFDVDANVTYYKDLDIRLPTRLDKDLYLLRLRVTDKNSDEVTKTYNLLVNPVRHGLKIDDVVFSPGTTVQAGRSLLATVLLENFGAKDEDDVKVTMSIDALGVNAYDFVDVESDDSKTTEELFIQIPQCAEPGEYTARVTAEFDEYESVSREFVITVVESDKCELEDTGKVTVTVSTQVQNVMPGQQATYPVVLVNTGNTARTYSLELDAGEWATASLSRNLIVLQPGQTEIVSAYLKANREAPAGEQSANLVVRSADGDVLEIIPLTVNVAEVAGSNITLRNGLEIALIVLVVILVIIGLIVGFSRLKRDEEFEEEQTYY
jgi:uncharacterized membrane protein